MEPMVLRKELVKFVTNDIKHWSSVGGVFLGLRSTTIESWLEEMTEEYTKGDEFAIYILSVMHNRHTVIYTSHRSWCTINTEVPLSEEDVHRSCDLHLAYLGQSIYGEVRSLPMQRPYRVPYSRVAPVRRKSVKNSAPPVPLDNRVPPEEKCDETLTMYTEKDGPDKSEPKPGSSFNKSSQDEVNKNPDDLDIANEDNPNLKSVMENAVSVDIGFNQSSSNTPDSQSNHKTTDDVDVVSDMSAHGLQHSYINVTPEVRVPKLSDLARKTVNIQSVASKNKYSTRCEIIKTPDCLKRLCIEYFRINYTAIKEQELGSLLKNRKINLPPEFKNLPTPPADFDKFLESLALKRKIVINVPKLSEENIQRWTKTHWADLDPYSDIEDIGDQSVEDATNQQESANDRKKGVHLEIAGGYCLRRRKRSYSTERPRRDKSKNTFYRELCESDSEKTKTKKVVKKDVPKPRPLNTGPTENRLLAQEVMKSTIQNKKNGITDGEKLRRSYPLFQPNRLDESDNITDSDATLDYEVPDYIVEVSKKNDPPDVPEIRCSVKTQTFGIRRSVPKKKIQYYRCHECKDKFDRLALLNYHYKEMHEPVHCPSCDKVFSTPSTLERHGYTHKELKYKCDVCEEKFAFASDRDHHMVKHSTEKKFTCKCGRQFFNKGDLKKHEEVHKNVVHKCKICEYSAVDPRNLKAHMRLHSNLKPYMCQSCLKLFKYHTQLKRHLPCKEKKTERSESPEY